MEDFGYSKEQEENYISSLIKRAFLIGASLFSIFCFIYITMSAINYFSENHGEIKTVEPAADPIKVVQNQKVRNEESLQIDSSIYEDIFGTRKKKKKKIKVKKVSIAPLPPKKEIISSAKKEIKSNKTQKTNNNKIIVYSESELKDQAKVLLNEIEEKSPKKEQKKGKNYVRVQIAAMTSKRSAIRYFKTLRDKNPNIFQGLEEFIEEVDLGKRGIFYRVQVGNFYDQIRAESFCKKYITQTSKSKADCIIVE